ncbi:MAG TPA: NAD(P)H-dependent glycerol-3-phosphate dehydrogenase [Clostridiales bacterium]|jgi:glycerol-3-phosphate dehydrogenase (NAD(P)+)|nr:NAD(P)H-dependent glycerol-3-phosphate dehydrogenase [Clostridiales bacterium]
MQQNIVILGAGSWGTALAISLSKNGHNVALWDIDTGHLEELSCHRENKRYLPDIALPEELRITNDLETDIPAAHIVLFAAPAQHFRSALQTAAPYMQAETIAVNVAKGIEQDSLLRLSEIADEEIKGLRYVVLSGPSHAEEVGRGQPTSVVAASIDRVIAEHVQDVFMSPRFRVYTSCDVIGVELGGALKNIIALGAGISDGMGFGDNAKAALMTRGLTEITRLGLRLGGQAGTFSGLSGVGDLIVTCTSMHSRNRRCGIMIGEGRSPEEAVKEVGMVVEGMFTTDAAYGLSQKIGVEMPITESIYQIIHHGAAVPDAVDYLMTRQKKHESEDEVCTLIWDR